MRDVVILFVHLIVTAVRLARPGGLRSVVAESVLVKHQLLILNHYRPESDAGGASWLTFFGHMKDGRSSGETRASQ
jgi:hypothetical protein